MILLCLKEEGNNKDHLRKNMDLHGIINMVFVAWNLSI